MHNKGIPLKIEVFSQDEEDDFILRDPREILSVLRDIAQQHNRVALYYNEASSMVLTLLLAVDENGLWVDASPNPSDNRNIERSQRIVFVSTHNQAKVQWISTETTQGLYQNAAAFYMPLPRKLLRLQRRDYYRLVNPEPHALKCRIRPRPEQRHRHHEVTIMDISIGGVALTCSTEEEVALTPGTRYPDCEIDLPELGTIHTAIEVRNVFQITARHGTVKQRAGCLFVEPDAETRMMLQRYVAQAQLAMARKKREEE